MRVRAMFSWLDGFGDSAAIRLTASVSSSTSIPYGPILGCVRVQIDSYVVVSVLFQLALVLGVLPT